MRTLWVLALVVAINALIWVPILLWMRWRVHVATQAIWEELERTRERTVLGPEPTLFCQAWLGRVGVSRVTAVVALTDEQLLVRPVVGLGKDIPLAQVAEVSGSKWFQHSYHNGRTHVILKLRSGQEVAFTPRDADTWVDVIAAAVRHAGSW